MLRFISQMVAVSSVLGENGAISDEMQSLITQGVRGPQSLSARRGIYIIREFCKI